MWWEYGKNGFGLDGGLKSYECETIQDLEHEPIKQRE